MTDFKFSINFKSVRKMFMIYFMKILRDLPDALDKSWQED